MSGHEQEKKLNKVVRERTFKVRLSEAEYQLMDSHNPYGSIAKLLRQSAVEKATKLFKKGENSNAFYMLSNLRDVQESQGLA